LVLERAGGRPNHQPLLRRALQLPHQRQWTGGPVRSLRLANEKVPGGASCKDCMKIWLNSNRRLMVRSEQRGEDGWNWRRLTWSATAGPSTSRSSISSSAGIEVHLHRHGRGIQWRLNGKVAALSPPLDPAAVRFSSAQWLEPNQGLGGRDRYRAGAIGLGAEMFQHHPEVPPSSPFGGARWHL
jgi:hypothetical protein